MSFTDDYNALKKKRKKQEKEKVAASGGTKFEKQYYTAAVDREPVEDIAPVRTTTTTFEAPTKGTVEILLNKSEKNSSTDYFGNETKDAQKKRTVFKSGEGNVAQKILGTIGDAAVGLAKGFVSSFEGITDLATYGAAGVADLAGNEDLAEDLKNAARESQTDKLLGGLEAKADKYSVLGDKADTFTNVLGQVASLFVGGGVGKAAGFGAKGVSAITTGMTAASSMGSGIGEAYEGGATDGEAVAFGAMSGLIDAGTELLAGGLGKSLGALGISRGIGGLDDMFAKKLASKVTGKIGNEFWKTTISNVTEFGVKSAAEGAEEVLAGYGSALAKKMTYMSDEELGQLVKDENILEQFVMGTLAGGVVSTPGLVSSTKGGTDYVTGYTQSEQKVIEAEVEKRITEAENNGEKPNKSKIYDEVVRDMEKGYIDTDTIESVLGGEDYSNYQRELKRQQDIDNELNELRNMKSGDMTDIQAERMAELKAMTPNTEMLDSLKFNVDEKVRGALGQGSRLSESYAERARRGQVFEADLSKYDDKQKAVIQKAIDSGILNNTNRTHEFVDMVAKISADKGVLFDFTNNEKLKGSSFAVDGAAVNGFITKDGITVNIDSRKAVNSVVGHEITHVLEGTELYTELQTALFEYAKGKGDYQGRYDTLAKLYEGVEGADVDAELAADLVGDYLFTDSDFINSLSTKHRNVFGKVYDEIKYLCKIATAGSREARELERVKRAFDKAYRESGEVSSDTKYSISDKNIKDVSTGYASGESYYTMSYTQDGKVVGTLEYGEYDGEPNVKMIEVAPEYRRQGIGTKLLQELQKKYPDTEIDFGMSTPDGTKLLDAITYDVTDEAVVADRQKLKDLQTELSDLQEKLDVLYDTETLTEAQETELHELGDRWQEVYETIHDLEKSVRGRRATKTFVKTDTKYSLSDSDGKALTKEQGEYFKDSKVRDADGNLKAVYHGSPSDFNEFSLNYLGANGTNEGYGFYFTDTKRIADGYSKGENGNGKLFEVYLDIKKPLSDKEVTISRAQFKKLLVALNNQVDADGERLDILSNYGDVEWEGLNKVLNYAIELEYDGNDNDVDIISSLVNSSGNLETVYRVLREVTGYDGIIVNEAEWGGDQTIYIAFHPEQIKNVDNLNPTSDPDIRRSLSAEGETPKQYGKWNIYGKDIRYTPTELAPVQDSVQDVQDSVQDAPVAEDAPDIAEDVPDIEPSEPSLQEMRERQDALYEELEASIAREDAEAFSRIGEEYNRVAFAVQQMEADEAERLSSLDDADAPPEVDAPYYEDEAAEVADPFDDRDIKAVGDRKVKAYMYENPEVKPFFQEEANILLGELREGTKGERIYTPTPDGQPGVYGSDSYGIWHGVKRHVSSDVEYLLDAVKMSYADIEKGLRAIIEDHGAENIAAAKKIEFVLNDRLLKGYQDWVTGMDIPPNQDYVNLINEKQITAYTDEARQSFFESVGATDIKPEVEDIAPVAEKYEAIRPPKQTAEPRMKRAEPKMKRVKEVEDDGKVAEVLTDEPKVNKSRTSAWAMFKNNVLDKGMVFEDLALETGNRELQARWNSIRYAEGKAQRLMEKGKANISSLKSIRETVEKSGKTQQFYEYLYHLHNVDRMSLEGRGAESIAKWRDYFKGLSEKQIQAIAAKEITDSTTEKTADGIRGAREYLNALDTKNKPVFGDSVTAEVSKETAAELESANPEFVEWSSEVYSYMNYLREELVANGVISRDTAKLWAEIYPHYVPIRRAGKDGAAINVPLDTGRTGINAPIKRATGGNSDILPLFDTMGQRTIQTYRAIAKNRFGVELKNTLGTTIGNEAAGVDDTIDSIDTDEGLLQEGKDGNAPTFTVFENGERVTFEITEEMYDAMKPTSKGLSYTNKVANTVGSVFRGLLTEYNPVFMTTNAVKDVQDILINSQHAARTYVNIPNAIAQMASGGRWYREYLDNGGERNTYFDNHSNTFKAEDNAVKKIVGMPLRIISGANNFIERVPRLAEYIASRKAGRSIDVSMLDAARVTTNFAAGGDLTKMLNRNGFNFLNASTQGAIQQVRNVREAKANGLRGWVQLAAKVTLAGLPALLLNDLLWDDDEEYEELADYVKDNYYIVAKYGDGQFVRIPKGRTLAVIQDAFEQMRNKITGDDEVDLKSFLDLAITNLAPNNPLDNNIIAPISQALSNRTWYGEDLVPTRLQDLPAAEQYDESTDSISKWLGERLDVSPYKLNYLLNQYSGGVGDVVLPMLTPETDGGGILAPFTDKFTTDSVLNNQNVSDFYDTVDELTRNAKSSKATDEDILKYKYMNSINAELGELYAEKREIQNSDLSDRAKLDAVRGIQEKIDSITRESLDAYGKVNIQGKYATVGDLHYKWYEPGEDSDTEPGWQKISDKQLQKQDEVTRGLGISASEYWSNKEEYDYAYDNPEKYAVAKSVGGYSAYKSYQSELYDIKADKDESGKSISGSRKEKVIDYVNGLDIDYGARLVLFKSEYNADDTYNYEIIDYLNSREDISYEDTVTILKELGFTVDSEGNIYW